MSDHNFWLSYLKVEQKITIWDIELTLFDFPTSQTMHLTKSDFESEKFQHLRELTFNDGDVIVDLGANLGIFSILMAKRFCNTRIYAVECMPHNLENLKLNLKNNKVDNIAVIPFAALPQKRFVNMCQHPLNSGSASQYLVEDQYPNFLVEGITLDDVFSMTGEHEVTFMKSDIEGSEHETFRSFTQWDKLKKMSIELHGLYSENEEKNKTLIDETARFLKDKMGDRVVILQ